MFGLRKIQSVTKLMIILLVPLVLGSCAINNTLSKYPIALDFEKLDKVDNEDTIVEVEETIVQNIKKEIVNGKEKLITLPDTYRYEIVYTFLDTYVETEITKPLENQDEITEIATERKTRSHPDLVRIWTYPIYQPDYDLSDETELEKAYYLTLEDYDKVSQNFAKIKSDTTMKDVEKLLKKNHINWVNTHQKVR